STIYRGPVPATVLAWRAGTILHEMAHMWFGDLVTMRWWDDLWLNESFATLMAVFAVDAATDFDDAWVGFATFNKQVGSRVDQLGTSHPVVTPVADVEAVRGNFDRITYEKGAAALRQLVAFVGEENFFAALHLYLTQHKEANAVFADLVDALQVTSGRDVQSWARAWLETVGINTLACEVESPEPGAPMSRATVVQSARPGQPTLRPHQIRVGLFDWVGDELGRVGSVELGIEGPRTEVGELIGVRRPPLLLPNDGDLSYAKIRLDPLSLATVQRHLGAVREPLARALIWDSLWDMTRDLELPAHRFAETVAEHLAGESDTTLVGVVLGNFRSATRRYGDPERGGELESAMAEAGWQVLASSPPGSDRQSVWLRGFISLATSPDQIERCQGILAGRDLPLGIALDAELRWLLVFALAARGAVGEREIKAALVADPSSSGMVRAAAARASRPTASAKRAAWARLAAATANVEEVRAISIRMGGVGREDLLLPYVPRLPRLFDTSLAKRGGEFAVELGDWLPLSLAPSPELATICRKNLERTDLDPLVRRIFANLLEDTERLLRARAFDQSELRAE
ncbi:MAG TPA: M1 family aminopeptidase, partial [Candidatus Dormibacteraeota bacterium]